MLAVCPACSLLPLLLELHVSTLLCRTVKCKTLQGSNVAIEVDLVLGSAAPWVAETVWTLAKVDRVRQTIEL